MTIIFGYISCFNSNDESVFNFNKKIISQLPECGAYICRDMFSMLPINNKALCYPTSTIIHFALEDRHEYYLSPERKDEFESLLSKLCWTSATIIETYAGNRYEWRADESTHNKLTPINKWEFSVYESYHFLNEIPYDNAPVNL